MTIDNELDWTAFCYLAGELTAAEAAAFEALLAEEQPAREALARAVELTQVVAAAESQGAPAVVTKRALQSSWQTRLAWMAIGGVASLALAMVYTGAFDRAWQAISPTRHTYQAQLAAAWSQTLQTSTEAEFWLAESLPPADFDEDLIATTDSPTDDIMEEIPSWLDAALVGSDNSSGD